MTKPTTASERPTIRRTSNGRVHWDRIDGFEPWFKETAPALTDEELVAAVQERYGVSVTRPQVSSLRRSYNALQSPEARQRALEARNERLKVGKPEKPAETPAERLDRDMLRKHIKSLEQRKTLFEMIGEEIITATHEIGGLPPPPPPAPLKKPTPGTEDMLLLISDVQAGQKLDADETGGLGHFNTEVLVEEIEYLQEAVDRIVVHHPDCRRLHVAWLGDIVEGVSIFPGQQRQIDRPLTRQIMFCVEHFARFSLHLASRFQEVHHSGVVGNHGRVAGRPGEYSPMDNFDYLVYRWMAERLATVKNTTWTVAETWWHIANVQGWRFLLNHGENTGTSYGGIPFYGAGRLKSRYRELLRTAKRTAPVPLPESDFDFLCIAHHHEPSKFFGIFMNGSWPGASELSLKGMQLGGMPTQKLMGVHKQYGVTWERDVNLRPYRLEAA